MTFALHMSKVKILLADDDKEDQLILTDSFSEIGRADSIQFVDDGELLLEYLHSIPQKEDLPSLIVLDLNMPRMSGTETLTALKASEEYKHIPVIIYSTSVNDVEMNKCLETGAEAYITKPVKYEDSIKTAQYFYDFSLGNHNGVPSVGGPATANT
ncbi:MAG: response regulator [Sphingobacteriales bacterium]|nr:MAG: response regulator [Sphingobacteriales bacterium]